MCSQTLARLILVTALIVMVAVLSGCAAAGPAKQILSQPAENIECTYKRKETKWSMDCKADGTVKLEGLPMPLPPLF